MHFVCGLAHTGADVQIKSALLKLQQGPSWEQLSSVVSPDVRSVLLYKRPEINTSRDGPISWPKV